MTTEQTFWTDTFECDGNCGAKVELTSRDPQRRVTRTTLESLDWLVVAGDEAYCPECTTTAARIRKAQPAQKRKK